MNGGFVRCTRLFLYKCYGSYAGYLTCTIFYCIYLKSSLHENLISVMDGAATGVCTSMLIMISRQHVYLYKAVRAFSITSKNYSLSSYVTTVISSLFSVATMGIILHFANIFVFTPFIAVIVFFLIVFLELLAEFCGLLIYKGNTKIGVGVSFAIYIACICIPIAIIFSNGATSLNAYLIAICLVAIALSASFFIINALIARNLEFKS